MNPTDNTSPDDLLFDRHAHEVNKNMMEAEKPVKRFKLPKFFKSESWSLMIMIAVGIGIGLILSQFVFRPYHVVGESMSDTLHNGDRLIVNKLGKTISSIFGGEYVPKRGEIIVFKSPFNDELLVKRVIGLPGERVVVGDGKITIYNEKFPNGFDPDKDQPYYVNLPPHTEGKVDTIVDENSLFVSGDNRTPTGSSDSRNDLGLVPTEKIIGDVIIRLFPLSDAHYY